MIEKIYINKFLCARCGYEWISIKNLYSLEEKKKHLPKICPKCKSRFWNTGGKSPARLWKKIKQRKRLQS